MVILMFIKMKNQICYIVKLMIICSFLFCISCISASKMMKQNRVVISDFSENNLKGFYLNKTDSVNNGSL